mmetsp:Transcript_24340/g.66059  ORF Transcript_24340/g.66059 Transcript_24340/m.66059 type:complete len:723 (+) Transcript_24340:1201-3369(+)
MELLAVAAGAALLASALDWTSLMGGEGRGARREISFQQFLSQVLPSGRVRRLVVVNGQTVRVYLGEYATGTPPPFGTPHASQDRGAGVATSSASQGQGLQTESALLARRQAEAGSASASSAGDEGSLSFQFTIGSVDQFEERLDAAQRDLGLEPAALVPVRYVSATSLASELLRWVPTALVLGLMVLMYRNATGGSMGAGGPGQIFQVAKSKAKRATKVDTSFKDVAGLQEAKAEVVEFVDFLKNPANYTRLGARIPKGALLVGPPGCGKTLLAKAVAGESEAPFFSISGSDFIEMFVGVGPARVRDMFAEARKVAPCLIFIDEIDAVGRARGRGNMAGGGNDERENTLNQLLIEMDGFSSTSGIVILAGTNRPDVLDSALLRPGRFDRQISVDKPDIQGREQIFGVHLAPLTLDGGEGAAADYANRLAALTPGMSGAEIANVCNEAALIAARKGDSAVRMKHLDAAVDRVLGGLEKKTRTQMERERRTVAWHEAGHAVAGWYLPNADPVMKVSIVPRGRAALGYSQSLPREIALYSEDHLEDLVRMALGGRAAEDIVFGEVSTGAQNDMERVTNIAQQCVMNFGFSPKVGHISFGRQGEESNEMYKPYSEKTAQLIDHEVRERVASSYAAVKALLEEKRPQLDALAERLLAKEVVGVEDLIEVLGPRKVLEGDTRYDEYIGKMLRPDERDGGGVDDGSAQGSGSTTRVQHSPAPGPEPAPA